MKLNYIKFTLFFILSFFFFLSVSTIDAYTACTVNTDCLAPTAVCGNFNYSAPMYATSGGEVTQYIQTGPIQEMYSVFNNTCYRIQYMQSCRYIGMYSSPANNYCTYYQRCSATSFPVNDVSTSGLFPMTESTINSSSKYCLDDTRYLNNCPYTAWQQVGPVGQASTYCPGATIVGSDPTGTPPPSAPVGTLSMVPTPVTRTITSGQATTYSVATTYTANTYGDIGNFSVSGCPANTTCTLSETYHAFPLAGETFNNILTIGGTPAAGTYTINVNGSAGSSNTFTSVQLIVNSSTPTPFCTSAGPTGFTTSATSGTIYVYAYGVTNALSVLFPTWSNIDTGGGPQSDIQWYPGTNMGGGTWRASINLASHRSGTPDYGDFTTATYAYPGAGNTGSPVFCANLFWQRLATLTNAAQCMSITTSKTTVAPGETFTARVVMRNTGTKTWESSVVNPSQPHNLGSQSAQDNMRWGMNRVQLQTNFVTPGNDATFNFTATAPLVSGNYAFDWKMVQDSLEWFPTGLCSVPGGINVVAPPPSVTFTGTSWSDGTRTTVWGGNNDVSTAMTVYSGAPFKLTWTSANATSCTINDGVGTVSATPASSGNINTYFAGFGGSTKTYTLSCAGSGGTTNKTFIVVVPPNPSGVIGSCNAAGTTGTISWTAPSGYTTFYTRVRTGIAGPDYAPGWDNTFIGTSKSFVTVPGATYSYWVHTRDPINGAWSDALPGIDNTTFTCLAPFAPTISNTTINPKPVLSNGTNTYTITTTATDANGGSDITSEFAIINFQGVNSGSWRGYLGWSTQGFQGDTNRGATIACTGGGSGAKIGWTDYGDAYINLLSCSTSVVGNTRTTNFVVSFNSAFITPSTNNTISGRAMDSGGLTTGWVAFDTFNLGPNLTAGSITPVTATVNTALPFTATITNNGGTSTGVVFPNHFQVRNPALVISTISALNTASALGAGATVAVNSSNYTFTSAGSYSVRACADNNASMVGVIAESNEGDNCGPWTTVTVSNVATVPVINSPTATGITITAATIGANVVSDGGSPIIRRGVCLGVTPAPTTSCIDVAGTVGVFTQVRSSLISGNQYYFSAYAVNAVGTSTVNSSFQTLTRANLVANIIGTPLTATTNIARTFVASTTNIGQTNTWVVFPVRFQVANVNATTANGGGGTITVIGVSTTTIALGPNGGTINVTSPSYSFTSAGTYSVRACADIGGSGVGVITEQPPIANENDNCGAYVDVVVSSGATVPSLGAPTASSITTSSAVLGSTITSDGGSAITARGTCWGWAASPTLLNATCASEGGTSVGVPFSHTRSGMNSNASYNFTGYATNGVGTGYSSVGSFATVANPLATVTLTASPVSPIINNTTVLTWTVSNATNGCTASGAWSGARASANGTYNEPPIVISAPTSFTLTCLNASNVPAVATLNVVPTVANKTLTITPSIGGIVHSLTSGIPDGNIICDPTKICTRSYPSGSQVILRATPFSNWKFVGWTALPSICSGSGLCTILNLNVDAVVQAIFAPRPIDYKEF